MNKIIKSILFIIVFTLPCTLYLVPYPAHAQELSLSISPPSIEVLVKPGKSLTQVFKIVNGGEAAILTAHIAQIDEHGVKQDASFSPEGWFTLINQDVALNKPFLLEAGQEKQLILKISPQKGTEEKDYYRALLITTNPTPSSEFSQTAISQTIGSPLLVTVSSTGLFEKKAEISSFTLPVLLDSFSPLDIHIALKNTGKTYFHAHGVMTLTSPIGKATYQIIPTVLLTGQTKDMKTESISENINSNSSLFLPGFYVGKYTLETEIQLDESTIKIYRNKTFYALPWKGLLIAIVLIIFILSVKKKRKKEKINKMKEPVVKNSEKNTLSNVSK